MVMSLLPGSILVERPNVFVQVVSDVYMVGSATMLYFIDDDKEELDNLDIIPDDHGRNEPFKKTLNI